MENLPKYLANSGALDIKKQLESISGGKVLDVATHSGTFIRTLISNLYDYDSFIGIDITSQEWDNNRFIKEPVQFIKMNGEILEFNDSTFDTVSISYSLHHLTSIGKVLEEMVRILKPKGTFILQEMFRDNPQTEAQKSDIMTHHWGAKIDSLAGIPHQETLTKQEIKQHVSKLNLQDERFIESTHSINCISCDDKFKCDDPKNSSVIDVALKDIDEYLEKLQKGIEKGIIGNSSEARELLAQGEVIKKRIRRHGSASASHLFITGRK
ncbi:MAG: class I SAM-dependent methyltransferase [Candidatus Hodarchaeales archaeon]